MCIRTIQSDLETTQLDLYWDRLIRFRQYRDNWATSVERQLSYSKLRDNSAISLQPQVSQIQEQLSHLISQITGRAQPHLYRDKSARSVQGLRSQVQGKLSRFIQGQIRQS